MTQSRRRFTQFLSLLPACFAALAARQVSANTAKTLLRPTPRDAEGPFYPTSWAGEVDNNLATLRGKPYANGQPFVLSGQVKSVTGNALAGARVELWQCDEQGKYRHPADGGESPAERGFQGYGALTTSADGAYAFTTIRPAPYGGRPAHLHLKLQAAGHRTLITQLYFAGEAGEGRGSFGGFSKERDRLTLTPVAAAPGTRAVQSAQFEFVLEVA